MSANLTRADAGVDVAHLTRPAGEPADGDSRLVSVKVPTQRRVVAFLPDLRLQPSHVRHAETIRLASPAAVEQATTDDKDPPRWPMTGLPWQSTGQPTEAAVLLREDGPEEWPSASSGWL